MTTITLPIRKGDIRLVILLFLLHNCAQIIGTTDRFFGLANYFDIMLLYCVYYIFFYWYKYKKGFFAGTFAKAILCVPILMFTSAMAAYIFYGQNPISGLLTQRAWPIVSFLYFPLRAQVVHGELTLKRFMDAIYFVAVSEAIVMLIQWALGAEQYFLAVRYTFRYGAIRIIVNPIYMFIAAMYATYEIMKRQRIGLNLFIILITMAYIFLVNKGRQSCAEYLFLIGVVVLFSDAQKLYKFIIIVGCILAGVYVFLQSDVVTDLMGVLIQGKKDSTYNVRLYSQKFYISTLNNEPFSWIFGYGMQNSTIHASNVATGATRGYLLTDNGIYGFVFSYGVFGLIWYLYLIFLQIKKGVIIYRKNHMVIMVFAMLIINIALYSTYMEFYYSYHCFSSILFYILIEILLQNNKSPANKLTKESPRLNQYE